MKRFIRLSSLMSPYLAGGLCLFLAGLLLVSFWLAEAPTPGGTDDVSDESVGTAIGQRHASVPLNAQSPAPPEAHDSGLPRSLRGTVPDGVIQLDADGNLMITRGIRDRFDYYLATLGEISLVQLIDRIESELAAGYAPEVATRLKALLHQYIDYREALMVEALEALPPLDHKMDIAAYQQRWQKLYDLRRRHLPSDVADAFWGAQERYDQYALERISLLNNPGLSDDERQAALSVLVETYVDVAGASIAARQPLTLLAAQQATASEQADSAALYRQRASVWGDAAAERLAALDQQRQAWEQRLQAYQQERTVLVASGVDETALATLQRQHFSDHELRLVQAMERLQ
ncbi:lipase secretion chaperone [Kistimonas scapharcae]|uniref:Lipase chaperone n=1 Tax=Kistimonas scapharcae TaxID=1036133 RepID=A0ABP8UWW6_9GAMM